MLNRRFTFEQHANQVTEKMQNFPTRAIAASIDFDRMGVVIHGLSGHRSIGFLDVISIKNEYELDLLCGL